MRTLPFTLRQMQYALAVADSGGFRRAAEICHVAQPSLSAQIAELEGALSVVLFERSPGNVRVTSAGEALIARMRRVVASSEELAQAARALEDPLTGEIRIGVIPTVASYVLPSLTPAFKETFPELRVLWTEDKTATLTESLARGALDGALLALEADIGPLEHVVVAKDEFVLAGAPGHPALAKRGLANGLAALSHETLYLLDDGHCFRDQTRDLCSAVGAREAGFRATSLATLVQVVLGAGGLTLLPSLSLAVENRNAQLAIKRFQRPAPSRTLALVYRQTSPIAAALRAIAAVMKRAYPNAR